MLRLHIPSVNTGGQPSCQPEIGLLLGRLMAAAAAGGWAGPSVGINLVPAQIRIFSPGYVMAGPWVVDWPLGVGTGHEVVKHQR